MQTSSHVEKDNWYDLGSTQPIMNIRTKGTYKPVVKPVVPKPKVKPCKMDNPVCPIDNQPLPVPCNLCPVNDLINENNQQNNTPCDNCQNCSTNTYGQSDIENSDVYGSRGIMEINLPEKEPVPVELKQPKKTTRKTTAKKTTVKKAKAVEKKVEEIIPEIIETTETVVTKPKRKVNRGGRRKVTD